MGNICFGFCECGRCWRCLQGPPKGPGGWSMGPSAPPFSSMPSPYGPPSGYSPYRPSESSGCCSGGCPSCISHHWAPPSHCSGSVRWEHCSNGHVPYGAVHAGRDLNGGEIFVGRAYHGGELLPAKVVPSHGCAYVPYAGTEHSKHSYEVLVSHQVAWRQSGHGHVPPDAICAGRTMNGEGLYVGRAMIDGTLTPGKVHPSHGCLYVPFGGGEHSFRDYELLILM